MSGGSAHRRRKKGGEQHEEHVNHERWLVTYADMLTLLMVLFIVLFAISQVDQKKFMQLATGMSSGFGQPVSITNGATSVLPMSESSKPVTDSAPAMSIDAIPSLVSEIAKGTGAGSSNNAAAAAAQAAADRDAADLDKAADLIAQALKKAGLDKKVVLSRDSRGLVVTVVVDDLVFPADSAELQTDGQVLLAAIGPALKATKHDILVEGHTNTVNVRPKNYPSEWELSSARASSVARWLITEAGLSPALLTVAGFADTRPLVPESDPRSTRLNRRVAIVVQSTLTGEQKALLDLIQANASEGN
jgi:chemotaxis protein MotB